MSVGRNAQSVLNCECWQSSLAGTHEYSWHFSAPPPAKKIKTIMVYGITVVSMPASEFWSLDFESRVPTFSVGSMSSLWAFQHPSKLQNKHASLIEDSKSAVTNILPKGNQVAPTTAVLPHPWWDIVISLKLCRSDHLKMSKLSEIDRSSVVYLFGLQLTINLQSVMKIYSVLFITFSIRISMNQI